MGTRLSVQSLPPQSGQAVCKVTGRLLQQAQVHSLPQMFTHLRAPHSVVGLQLWRLVSKSVESCV